MGQIAEAQAKSGCTTLEGGRPERAFSSHLQTLHLSPTHRISPGQLPEPAPGIPAPIHAPGQFWILSFFKNSSMVSMYPVHIWRPDLCAQGLEISGGQSGRFSALVEPS